MSGAFTAAEIEALAGPHVARCWLLALHLPDGIVRMHSGVGALFVAGQEWRGVTDPVGPVLLSMSNVEAPSFGQAASVQIVLSGVRIDFVKWLRANARLIEGLPADLYWAAFDGETQDLAIAPKKLFPHGRITSPAAEWAGLGLRTVSMTVESIWSSQNFPPGGKWNGTGQRQRFAGDKGLDFVGVKVNENWI